MYECQGALNTMSISESSDPRTVFDFSCVSNTVLLCFSQVLSRAFLDLFLIMTSIDKPFVYCAFKPEPHPKRTPKTCTILYSKSCLLWNTKSFQFLLHQPLKLSLVRLSKLLLSMARWLCPNCSTGTWGILRIILYSSTPTNMVRNMYFCGLKVFERYISPHGLWWIEWNRKAQRSLW